MRSIFSPDLFLSLFSSSLLSFPLPLRFVPYPPSLFLSLSPSRVTYSSYLRLIGNASGNSIDRRSSNNPQAGEKKKGRPARAEREDENFLRIRTIRSATDHSKRSRGNRDACAHLHFSQGGKSCFLAGSAYRSNFSRVYSYLSAGMKFHRAGIPFADVRRRKVRSG